MTHMRPGPWSRSMLHEEVEHFVYLDPLRTQCSRWVRLTRAVQ